MILSAKLAFELSAAIFGTGLVVSAVHDHSNKTKSKNVTTDIPDISDIEEIAITDIDIGSILNTDSDDK